MKIRTIISTLLFSILIISGCQNQESKELLRDKFGQIIDVSYTPTSEKGGDGWFTDEGSWMGFTIPSKQNWVNGFCGPFSIDNRYWMAQSATVVSWEKQPQEIFVPDSVSYFPGEIYISASSQTGNIKQNLIFADANTAILTIEKSVSKDIVISGSSWAKGTQISLSGESIIVNHPSGEAMVITFLPKVELSLTEGNYSALCDTSKRTYVAISFITDESKQASIIQNASKTLKEATKYIGMSHDRWNEYLGYVLRDDMPHGYDRIAVKSVVTLMSNWRTAREGLLHDGIIPSHAVDYFIGFWAWDSWRFSAALASIAPELAKDNIRAMFDYQLPDGMIIDCIYTDSTENNARNSKPPLAGWAVSEIFKSTLDTTFLREIYPKLLKYHRWWYEKRDHDKNGICEFGSTDGTLVAAAWESGMDNAIRFDDTKMLKNGANAWSMDQESVDLNAYLTYEYTLLKEIAEVIGEPFNEKNYTEDVADYFFDKERGFFFDRRLKDGSFVLDEGCEAYTPFWTGIASAEQMNKALRLFTDTTKFATYIPFPTVAADNPDFMAKGYWRGPIWLDQTYFAINGLRYYGHDLLADQATRNVFDRLHGLQDQSPIHENYGTHTGELLKAPHFSWSAAHLLMMYKDYKIPKK